jgi:triosephosphate isomerase
LVTRAEVVVSPPFVFLPQVKGLLRLDFAVAAQNCWVRKGGAFTGEIRLLPPLVWNMPWFSVVLEVDTEE